MNSIVYKRIRNVKLVRSQDRAAQNEAVISPSFPIGVKMPRGEEVVQKALSECLTH